jgi:hypothetical protein
VAVSENKQNNQHQGMKDRTQVTRKDRRTNR